MKKTYDPYVPTVPNHIHNQNMVDFRDQCNSPKNFGVVIAAKFSDGIYFDPDTEMFGTRTQAYNYAKRCEARGDKIINRIGF